MYLRIKDIIKEKGLTIKELAAKIGITREALTNIVNEKANPAFDTLINLAAALDVQMSELFAPTKPGLII